eukprot:SAG31_NODE_10683_length_1110_cov_0.814045_1_plen_160_part_00
MNVRRWTQSATHRPRSVSIDQGISPAYVCEAMKTMEVVAKTSMNAKIKSGTHAQVRQHAGTKSVAIHAYVRSVILRWQHQQLLNVKTSTSVHMQTQMTVHFHRQLASIALAPMLASANPNIIELIPHMHVAMLTNVALQMAAAGLIRKTAALDQAALIR